MDFLSRFLDLLASWWAALSPVQVVDVGHRAGRKRLGKYHSTLEAGLHWKIPLADVLDVHPTTITTHRFDSQTLTTKDDKQIVVRAIVRYAISDLEKYITLCFDQSEILEDTGMGEIQKQVREHTWGEFDAEALEKSIATAMRRAISRFGFEIHSVTLTDVGRMRSIRLITTSPLHPGHG